MGNGEYICTYRKDYICGLQWITFGKVTFVGKSGLHLWARLHLLVGLHLWALQVNNDDNDDDDNNDEDNDDNNDDNDNDNDHGVDDDNCDGDDVDDDEDSGRWQTLLVITTCI